MSATADSATGTEVGNSKGVCDKWQVLLFFHFNAAALAPRPCPPCFQADANHALPLLLVDTAVAGAAGRWLADHSTPEARLFLHR